MFSWKYKSGISNTIQEKKISNLFYAYFLFEKLINFLKNYPVIFKTYILFIKISRAIFDKNHFLNFSLPLHISHKNMISRLKLDGFSYHMDTDL